jgi:hypothetical protein
LLVARAKAKHLGSVEAADAEAAIEAAAKEFKVAPKRLVAVRRAACTPQNSSERVVTQK